VARIQINIVAIIIVLNTKNVFMRRGLCPVKNTIVSNLIIKILAYSAMKINANRPPLYSTLNPDTSSDSPSAKSKGVRFVSARLVINHIIERGMIIIVIHDFKFVVIIDISIELCIISADRRIKDILTSYEIVCATPRSAPNRAYLEFDPQPAMNVVYTFILDTHKKYRAPNVMKMVGFEWG
jgi:hypothetical protein